VHILRFYSSIRVICISNIGQSGDVFMAARHWLNVHTGIVPSTAFFQILICPTFTTISHLTLQHTVSFLGTIPYLYCATGLGGTWGLFFRVLLLQVYHTAAGTVSIYSGSEQCCYRTFDLMNTDKALAS
jgi:hypothetical protein